MAIHTLLGGNGTIGTALIPVLKQNGETIRVVSRSSKAIDGVECIGADMLDNVAVMEAVKGSDIVYLLVGIEYNAEIWKRDWPIIMKNVIEACKTANAKLIFFDNVYMYGKVANELTESSAYAATSKKGIVRAGVAKMLETEMASGSLRAAIARAVDFYGPNVTDKSAPGVYVFNNLKNGKTAQWPINADVPRSFNYVPDAAAALYILATHEEANGQIWHLPSAKPVLTGREFVKIASKYMNSSDKVLVLPKWILKIIGLFVPFLKEAYEMNYQDEYALRFNSDKFEKAFSFTPTPYEEGIKATAMQVIKKG